MCAMAMAMVLPLHYYYLFKLECSKMMNPTIKLMHVFVYAHAHRKYVEKFHQKSFNEAI